MPVATELTKGERFTSANARDRSGNFDEIFYALKTIFAPFEKYLNVSSNTRGRYYVETRSRNYEGKPLFVGAVLSRKSYVSFQLMALYWKPALLKGMSPALKKHMDGKTGFNFTEAEPALFRELASLTRRGLAHYRRKNLL